MLFLLLSGCGGPSSGCAEADLFYSYTYPDGTFGGCTFEKARDIQGVRCLGKPFEISMWPDGSLAHCYLDGAQTVAGLQIPVDSSVSLYEDGTIGVWAASPNTEGPSPTVTYKGKSCTKAEVHANGVMASCVTFGEAGSKDTLKQECWDESGEVIGLRDCRMRELDTPYMQWRARTKKSKR